VSRTLERGVGCRAWRAPPLRPPAAPAAARRGTAASAPPTPYLGQSRIPSGGGWRRRRQQRAAGAPQPQRSPLRESKGCALPPQRVPPNRNPAGAYHTVAFTQSFRPTPPCRHPIDTTWMYAVERKAAPPHQTRRRRRRRHSRTGRYGRLSPRLFPRRDFPHVRPLNHLSGTCLVRYLRRVMTRTLPLTHPSNSQSINRLPPIATGEPRRHAGPRGV